MRVLTQCVHRHGGTPTSAGGAQDATTCCPSAACSGRCGGAGCDALSGGAANCCAGAIASLDRPCALFEAPCTLTVTPPPTAAPTASERVERWHAPACLVTAQQRVACRNARATWQFFSTACVRGGGGCAASAHFHLASVCVASSTPLHLHARRATAHQRCHMSNHALLRLMQALQRPSPPPRRPPPPVRLQLHVCVYVHAVRRCTQRRMFV
jgi:hypothetical protein